MSELTTRNVEGWALAAGADGEPMIQDEELARLLGYERPRDVRKLVARHLAAGNLNDSDVRATVARTRIGVADRDVEEFWLTEPAALFIAAKSETSRAVALTREVIRVFVLARRGALPGQLTVKQVRDIVRAELEGRAAPPTATSSPRTSSSWATPPPVAATLVEALVELSGEGARPVLSSELLEALRAGRFPALRAALPWTRATLRADGLPSVTSVGRLLSSVEGASVAGWRVMTGRTNRNGARLWGVVRG